jgi:hypothetical protein
LFLCFSLWWQIAADTGGGHGFAIDDAVGGVEA